MKPIILFLTCIVLLGLSSLLFFCNENKQDEVAIANRLADFADFENAEKKEGEPPPENAGDKAYPQIITATTPPDIFVDQLFQITLATDYADGSKLKKAIVYIDKATSYFEVAVEFKAIPKADGPTGMVTIRGKLTDNEGLGDKDFQIRLGLMDVDGKVGNYYTWQMEVPPEPPPPPKPEDKPICTAEEIVECACPGERCNVKVCSDDGKAYSRCGCGLITDKDTNLMWQQSRPCVDFLWADAKKYCDTLDLGGFTDWHLPTKAEYMDILGGCDTAVTTDGSGFGGFCDACVKSYQDNNNGTGK